MISNYSIFDPILSPFTHLLNQQQHIFRKWDDLDDSSTGQLIEGLMPWITRESNPSLQYTKRPELLKLNCGDELYHGVLTGETLSTPRLIVDFIPFGYDIDKLEIRFYELYDVVDAFVIYEQPMTLKGIPKPLFFDIVRNQSRFINFTDKIIHIKGEYHELKKVWIKNKYQISL